MADLPKRFWADATLVPVDGGFAIRLDGRPVRTPGRAELILPNAALAERIAAEWRAQGERVDPRTMPATRTANSAIDKVAPALPQVVEIVAAYGENDLLCYRATGPEGLVALQAQAWDPLLGWAAAALDAPLGVTTGVMPVAQSPGSVAALRAALPASDPWQMSALHDCVALTGSLVLGLAAAKRHRAPEDLWEASVVDEVWQARIWGDDEQAARDLAAKRAAFLQACAFLTDAREG